MAVSRLGVLADALGLQHDPGLHLVVVHFVQRHAAEHGMCAVVE